jgi:hypothetical protein
VPPLSFTTRLLASLAATTALVVGVAACGGGEGTGDRDPETEGVTVYSGRIPPLIGPAIDL